MPWDFCPLCTVLLCLLVSFLTTFMVCPVGVVSTMYHCAVIVYSGSRCLNLLSLTPLRRTLRARDHVTHARYFQIIMSYYC